MFNSKWRLTLGLAAGLFGVALVASAADDSGLETQPDRKFVHHDAKTALKVPPGWTILPPYRLRRTTSATVLGIEKENPQVSITVVWSPIGKRDFNDIIRAASDEKLGEEYAMLTTVYGKGKVSRPTTIKVGKYTIYKILIDAGPDREGRSAGAVYLFEAGEGDNKWKVKVRAMFPQLNREEYIKQVEEVIGQFVTEE